MNRDRWIFSVVIVLFLVGFGLYAFWPKATPLQPTPPAAPARPAVVKKAVAPAPAPPAAVAPPVQQVVPETVINIYPLSPAPQPAPVPQPAPSVQMPAPPLPPVVQPQVQPPAPPRAPEAVMASAPPSRTTVNVLSGNSIQFRVEVFSRWGGTYGGPSYGYGYGRSTGATRWVPGFQRWVCEGPPSPAGPGCYWKWEPAHYE